MNNNKVVADGQHGKVDQVPDAGKVMAEDRIGTDEGTIRPLTVLCDFCGSKPFYNCINRETQKPIPFFHIARTVTATKQVQQAVADGPAEGIATEDDDLTDEVCPNCGEEGVAYGAYCHQTGKPWAEPGPVEPAAPVVENSIGIISHPATETTRPYEESTCEHCGDPIWRITDENSTRWMHRAMPSNPCKPKPLTYAKPVGLKASQPTPAVVRREESFRELARVAFGYFSKHFLGKSANMYVAKNSVHVEVLAEEFSKVSLTAQPAPLPSDQKMDDAIDKAEVVAWLEERMLNARRIADTKHGDDKHGWNEDALFLESAIHHIALPSDQKETFEQWWDTDPIWTTPASLAKQAWNAAKGGTN